MEYINCILCEGDRTERFLVAEDIRYNTSEERFTVVRCRGCGLVFVNPRPSKDEMPGYYPVGYRPRKTLAPEKREKRMKKYERRRTYCFFRNPWHLDLSPGMTVLDIGCGSGELLIWLERSGCTAHGIDIDAVTSRYLRDEGHLNVQTGDAEKGTPFRNGFFDMVVMRHSLEHFHHPVRALQEVSRILRPGGTLIVGLPNIESFVAKVAGEVWKDLDIPRHLFHFSPATASALLERAGFRVEDICHEMKVSRESLKRSMPGNTVRPFFRSTPLMSIAGIVFSLFRRSEWIVVRARR